MEKILTISVAAYQVEAYIEKLLYTVTAASCIDELEVLICDDGGSDATLSIAEKYAEKYPSSVIPLHKENGGYGSVLNLTVPMAKGKYFKTLDGDDWVLTKGLETLVEALKSTDADWVLTKAERVYEDGSRAGTPARWSRYEGEYPVEEIAEEKALFWHVNTAFRTDVLQKAFRPLPEHSLYTDILYMAWPLPYVRSVLILPETVYCYRDGRPGQSVSNASKRKHWKEQVSAVRKVIAYYTEKNGDRLPPMVRTRFYVSYKWLILTFLLLPPSLKNLRRIVAEEKKAQRDYPGFYEMGAYESGKIRLLRKSGYLAYWPLAVYESLRLAIEKK